MSERGTPGAFHRVDSPANPIVKELRALSMKKERDRTGRFLGEGLKLVRDALLAGFVVEDLIASADSLSEGPVGETAAEVKARGGRILAVSHKVLEKLSHRENPQTVIGVFRKRLAKPEEIGGGGFWIGLDRIRDPGNLGTILRTADAVGAAGIALVGECCDPFSLEAVRASMGSFFHVPLALADETAFLAAARANGARILGTHLSATQDFRGADYSAPVILLMGNERQGLTESLARACDELLLIPMRGKADSLNLAIATGLVSYEAYRRSAVADGK
ncbi:RNA methyltransferase [Afifella sp. IM 167]|uniref:TrmH family RNA methyltransferase n=1 Tax=Afifella sp. IM 167 TaxID=2033586 RepID=UPI001CC8FB24|nr:RNA methyltransferase [Afifella sp. IM 167]MBZ8132955.1 RNA methyltransferase [Afifella sp. IM 167]